jgi:hypothetical protein
MCEYLYNNKQMPFAVYYICTSDIFLGMKRTYFPFTLLLAMLVALLAVSCESKYEDGPLLSLTSKKQRVVNLWKADFVFRNQLDETDKYGLYVMNFEDSRLTWRTQLNGAPAEIQRGAAWEFAAVKEQIRLQFDEKDPVTGETQLLFLEIRRLKSDELWVTFLAEGDYYEVRLSPI